MNRRSITIITTLVVVLALSNGWWFWRSLDHSVTDMSQDSERDFSTRSIRAALKVLPTLSTELRRDQIVSRVAAALDDSRPFDKDGWTVVAPLMLRFDDRGRLLQAATIYDARQ